MSLVAWKINSNNTDGTNKIPIVNKNPKNSAVASDL